MKLFINKLILSSLLISALSGLTGCATISGIGKDNTPPPTPLTAKYTAQVIPKTVWATNAGDGVGKNNFNLVTALGNNNQVFTADRKGQVTAVNATTGKQQWQIDLKEPLVAGPAVSNNLVFVAGDNADLYALQTSDGKIAWHVSVSGQITAVPVVVNNLVIVKTLDGQLWALNLSDGKTVWQYNHGSPPLVLAGGSKPQIVGNTLITGYEDGKLAAYDLNQGGLLWETQIASPLGASDIEQLVGIVADPVLADNTVYVVTYQGNLAAVNAKTGQVNWQQPVSSYTGLVVANQRIFVTDATGNVLAFDRTTGERLWQVALLRYRLLTAPAAMGNNIVIGDGEGYLHWLNQADGTIVGRVAVSTNVPIVTTPIVVGNNVFVLTSKGFLVRYQT